MALVHVEEHPLLYQLLCHGSLITEGRTVDAAPLMLTQCALETDKQYGMDAVLFVSK